MRYPGISYIREVKHRYAQSFKARPIPGRTNPFRLLRQPRGKPQDWIILGNDEHSAIWQWLGVSDLCLEHITRNIRLNQHQPVHNPATVA